MDERQCAFTGHRPKKLPWGYDETDSRCAVLKDALARQLEKLAGEGYTGFFSGMAEGTDTWAALAVLALREKIPALQLHCVLPWEGQADRWSDAARERYHAVLQRADSVKCLSRHYYDGCLLERNRYLVENASLLLAVYNGERRGGTAMTVRYARKLGREMIILDPYTGKITR